MHMYNRTNHSPLWIINPKNHYPSHREWFFIDSLVMCLPWLMCLRVPVLPPWPMSSTNLQQLWRAWVWGQDYSMHENLGVTVSSSLSRLGSTTLCVFDQWWHAEGNVHLHTPFIAHLHSQVSLVITIQHSTCAPYLRYNTVQCILLRLVQWYIFYLTTINEQISPTITSFVPATPSVVEGSAHLCRQVVVAFTILHLCSESGN